MSFKAICLSHENAQQINCLTETPPMRVSEMVIAGVISVTFAVMFRPVTPNTRDTFASCRQEQNVSGHKGHNSLLFQQVIHSLPS